MDAAAATTTLRKRPLSVRTSTTSDDNGAHGRTAPEELGEPVSPSARLVEDFYIIVVIGGGTPLNIPALRAGIEAQLARYPHFRSIQVTDKDGTLRWAPTTVNVENQLICPKLDPAAVAADPDKAVEDYVASLSTLPMDWSRPLWEFHLFDFPTSEATATTAIRVHHSLGDGMSLLTLLMSCTRSAADPTRLPAMPPLPARTGAIYQRPRPSAGALAYVAWVWSFFVLAWHTLVDVVGFFATILCLKDPHTLFKRVNHGESQRKRIVHRSLSLDDVKFVKNAMKCTVNDVLVGVTYAALSRYYFRKSGDSDKEIRVRSILLVNLRPTTSLIHRFLETFSTSRGVPQGAAGGLPIPSPTTLPSPCLPSAAAAGAGRGGGGPLVPSGARGGGRRDLSDGAAEAVSAVMASGSGWGQRLPAWRRLHLPLSRRWWWQAVGLGPPPGLAVLRRVGFGAVRLVSGWSPPQLSDVEVVDAQTPSAVVFDGAGGWVRFVPQGQI